MRQLPLIERNRCDGDHESRLTALRGPSESLSDVILRLVEIEAEGAIIMGNAFAESFAAAAGS